MSSSKFMGWLTWFYTFPLDITHRPSGLQRLASDLCLPLRPFSQNAYLILWILNDPHLGLLFFWTNHLDQLQSAHKQNDLYEPQLKKINITAALLYENG